jgi:hypothetical protein
LVNISILIISVDVGNNTLTVQNIKIKNWSLELRVSAQAVTEVQVVVTERKIVGLTSLSGLLQL